MTRQEAYALIADLTPDEKRLLHRLLLALKSTSAEPSEESPSPNDRPQLQSSERKYS